MKGQSPYNPLSIMPSVCEVPGAMSAARLRRQGQRAQPVAISVGRGPEREGHGTRDLAVLTKLWGEFYESDVVCLTA